MKKTTSYLSPFQRINFLGSAHSGTHHFIYQRISAVANLFILIAFIVMLTYRLSLGSDREMIAFLVTSNIYKLIMILACLSFFYHARLGLQVVIEDYTKGSFRYLLLIAMNLGILLLQISFCLLTLLNWSKNFNI